MSESWPEGTHESRTCAVHPFGYHRQPRVNPAPSRHVFRGAGWGGLPQRCEFLEHELEASDRERDFIDELWIRERATRGHGLAMAGASVLAAVVLAIVMGGATATAGVLALLIGGAVVIGLDRVDDAVHRERLRRIRDWHRRVGSPR